MMACGDENTGEIHTYIEDSNNHFANFQTKTGSSNGSGVVKFTDDQSGETVTVNVMDESGKPISNATVTFIDGDGFEFFHAEHSKYTGAPVIREHNSSLDMSLTLAPLQVLHHDKFSNDLSKKGAENFISFAEANWDYIGCLDINGLYNMMDSGAWFFKALSKGFSMGIADAGVSSAKNYLKTQLDADTVGHIWFKDPEGFATSTIWTVDIKKASKEVAGNDIDDDCDGKVDNVDSSGSAGGSRFTDKGNGTVLDTQTSLLWQKSPVTCGGCYPEYAVEECSNGWRAPSKSESLSIRIAGSGEDSYDMLPTVFNGDSGFGDLYLSSTTDVVGDPPYQTTCHFKVSYNSTDIDAFCYPDGSMEQIVRCVKGN